MAPDIIGLIGSSFCRIASSAQSNVENRPPHIANPPAVVHVARGSVRRSTGAPRAPGTSYLQVPGREHEWPPSHGAIGAPSGRSAHPARRAKWSQRLLPSQKNPRHLHSRAHTIRHHRACVRSKSHNRSHPKKATSWTHRQQCGLGTARAEHLDCDSCWGMRRLRQAAMATAASQLRSRRRKAPAAPRSSTVRTRSSLHRAVRRPSSAHRRAAAECADPWILDSQSFLESLRRLSGSESVRAVSCWLA
jgi:hypothetical protein